MPSMPAKTADPGLAVPRSDRNSAEGLATLGQPRPGHLEHADLVGRPEAVLDRAQDAELVAAFAFEIKHAIDHMLDDARPGDLAILGHMADEDHRSAALFGEADQFMRGGADLSDRTGCCLDHVGP